MRRLLPLLLLAGSLPALGGCVALAVPVAAAGVMGKRVIDPNDRDPARGKVQAGAHAGADGVTYLPAGSSLPPPTAAASVAVDPPAAGGAQFPDGSGEAAAASHQAWRALIRFAAKSVAARPEESVVLAAGASLDTPDWVPCAQKPLAAVLDLDEGAGHGKVAAVAGAKDAIGILRTMGVAVVFTSNLPAAAAPAVEAALDASGLGPARHGETLFLTGDDATGARKDARRAAIAGRYCVIVIGGDQLGDFSDLFDAGQPAADRGAAASSVALGAKWGAGWFLLPSPVAPATRRTPAP